MNTTDRRMEIVNILIVRRRTTAKELAEEFGVTTRTIRNDIQLPVSKCDAFWWVTTRTIRNDIQALSPGYPIYTQQGGAGGIFLGDDYRPYINTLSSDELDTLCEIYRQAEGLHKKILLQIINKYGSDKLKI